MENCLWPLARIFRLWQRAVCRVLSRQGWGRQPVPPTPSPAPSTGCISSSTPGWRPRRGGVQGALGGVGQLGRPCPYEVRGLTTVRVEGRGRCSGDRGKERNREQERVSLGSERRLSPLQMAISSAEGPVALCSSLSLPFGLWLPSFFLQCLNE